MKVFIVLAVALISVASASRRGKPDLYWRDFYGQVPKDALKVPTNGTKGPVYIGQGYFEGFGVLPGTITDGEMKLQAVASGAVRTTKSNIKILATDSTYADSDFPWIWVHYQNLEKLGKLHFLNFPVGGSETDSNLYIGRHSEPGYTNIGKIYTLKPYQGLTIPDKHGKVTIYKHFEVLAMLNFDCEDEEVAPRRSSWVESSEDFPGVDQDRLRSSRLSRRFGQ